MAPTSRVPASLSEERDFIHNLATPLATLTLLTEGLCETASTESEKQRAQQIKRNVDKLNEFLRARREVLVARSSGP